MSGEGKKWRQAGSVLSLSRGLAARNQRAEASTWGVGASLLGSLGCASEQPRDESLPRSHSCVCVLCAAGGPRPRLGKAGPRRDPQRKLCLLPPGPGMVRGPCCSVPGGGGGGNLSWADDSGEGGHQLSEQPPVELESRPQGWTCSPTFLPADKILQQQVSTGERISLTRALK